MTPTTSSAETEPSTDGAQDPSVPVVSVAMAARRPRSVAEPPTGVIRLNEPPMKSVEPDSAMAVTFQSAAGAQSVSAPVPAVENAARRDRDAATPPLGVTAVNPPPT